MSTKPCDFAHVLGYSCGAAPSPASPSAGAADDALATPEQLAAVPFEAWERDWSVLPSKQQWDALADPHLIHLRTGLATMWQTKAELIEACAAEPEAFEALMRALDETAEVLDGFVQLAHGASLRVLSSLTAVALRRKAEGRSCV